MRNLVTPEAAYRAFWIWWSVVALASQLVVALVVVATLLLGAKLWLVPPIIKALAELKR